MPTARLHDDTTLDVTIRGAGPALLLPARTTVTAGPEADRIRAWGADPNLGHALAEGLATAGFRVVAADYEGHLSAHPRPTSLTARTVAADLLAIADAAGADRFAYYGYSWLALAGLQLAVRTDRLTALAMGGFPPLGGPYDAMLAVTWATHEAALASVGAPPAPEAEPGDWDAAEVTLTPEQTQQYVTLYESLRGFDERAALDRLTVPRLAFAGADDRIVYGPKWGNVTVAIGEPLARHRDELTAHGWTVEIVPGGDHMTTMQAAVVLPILTRWLPSVLEQR
jgi:pimeloyl-ACP methyl ester carboxylesterase